MLLHHQDYVVRLLRDAAVLHAANLRAVAKDVAELVVLLLAYTYPWRLSVQHPAQTIVALNAWMKDYASKNGVVYLDYHSAMADERLGMKNDLSGDGVHPNEAGYRLMAPLTEAAIREALRK